MPYPATISNSSTYPRTKNSIIGAFLTTNALRPVNEQLIYNFPTTLYQNIGSSVINAQAGASFTANETFQVGSVFMMLNKNSLPADTLIIEFREDNGAGLPSATVVGSGVTVLPASLMGGAVPQLFELDFTALSVNLVADTRYHLIGRRSGAIDALSYYRIAVSNTNPDPDSYQVVFRSDLGTWSQSATNDPMFIICQANVTRAGAMVFLVNETTSKLEAWVSYDQGMTWAIRDSFHSRVMLAGDNTRRSVEATAEITDVAHVGYPNSTFSGEASYFDLKAMAWRYVEVVSSGANAVSVAGVVPWFSEVRTSDSVKIYTFQGAVEAARRRIKLHRLGGGTTLDIITGTTGLPGTAVDYDLRFMIEGGSSDTLLFWTQSDTNSIQFRRYKSDNTFGAIVSLPGTTDAAAAYPLGVGTIYTSGGVKYVAIPYYDTVLGGIAVARCIASGVDTAGNWSTALAISCTPETALSNPAVLASDGGNKLWVWVVNSVGRKLLYSHDGGTGTWIAPTDWKPTQTYSVAGISMRVLSDRITLVYLDDAVTPARVKYDQLALFF